MMRLITLLVSIFLTTSSGYAAEDNNADESVISGEQLVDNWRYPKSKELENGTLHMYAPQIVSWEEFEEATLLMALEFHPDEESDARIYATLELTSHTDIDMEERIVTMSEPEVERVIVHGESVEEYAKKLSDTMQRDSLEVPLDIFLVSLAHDVLLGDENPGFNPQPPTIVVTSSSTIVLNLSGEPLVMKMTDTPYSIIGNSNWPLLKETDSDLYYLLHKQTWWTTADLEGDWQKVDGRPRGLDKLDPEGEFAPFMVEPADSGESEDLSIYYAADPTELISIDGEPEIEMIEEAEGLSFVSNTQSPLFVYQSEVYFLTSGRWFSTANLQSEEWTLLKKLPDVFSDIPPEHGMGYVRASVPGTLEAKTALLEAQLPEKKTLAVSDRLELENQYVGEPKFENIPNTSIARATNSGYDIFLYQGVFYLCYEGAWYQSDYAEGPWIPAFRVPDDVYRIPATSPSYPVTQVQVASSTSTSVVYVSSSSYYTGIYSYYGMPVYGTGWYYPPHYSYYYRYGYYPYARYPYYRSYGYGSFYNPRTGGYTSRSVWSGPYGGYSYNQHYNPRTGRSGYVETAWNDDGWASYGETYNPRTDVYTETERSYSDDKDRYEMEREITKGDRTLETHREVDFDDGWSTTTREGSEGGSSYVERHRQDDGSITSDGTITNKDGQSARLEGEINDGKRRTEITGEDGGKLVSGGDGDNRAMLGKDADGNLYAGHNGDVYKKDGDSWYSYDRDDGWSEMDRPERTSERTSERRDMSTGTVDAATQQRMNDNANRTGTSKEWTNNARTNNTRTNQGSFSNYSHTQQTNRMNQLHRDSQARSMGSQQFKTRRNNSQFNRGSMGGRSMGARSMGGMRGGGGRR